MAIVKHLEAQTLATDSAHTEVDCTYTVVTDKSGNVYLQIDTYGSKERKMPGKKSQSIRFSREAVRELAQIIRSHFSV